MNIRRNFQIAVEVLPTDTNEKELTIATELFSPDDKSKYDFFFDKYFNPINSKMII